MTDRKNQIKKAVAQLADRPLPPLLMFDYDGTLAPFVVDREQARPYPWVASMLAELRTKSRAHLVIVSGRPAADVARLLAVSPDLEIWGCHGWERLREDGTRNTGRLSPQTARALKEARSWVLAEGLGGRLEEKPASLAVHWRGEATTEQQRLSRHLRSGWALLARAGGLELHAFDGGLELRLQAVSKADAVTTLRAEFPAGTPLGYFGDDLTDEDAFRALARDDVGVLVRGEYRTTAARVWIKPPDELRFFLAELLTSLQERHARNPVPGGVR